MRIYFNCLLYLVVLLTTFSQFVDCCSRRSSSSSRRPPPPAAKTTIPSTTIPQNYRLRCTASEANQTACLNGGECSALQLGNTRALNCHCLADYTGTRCQEQKIDLFFIRDRMKTANVAAGVTVAIVICVAILVGVYIYIRWHRKRRVAEVRQQREGPIIVPFRNTSSHSYNDMCKQKEQQLNSVSKDAQLVNSSMCIMNDVDGNATLRDVNRNNGNLYLPNDYSHGDDRAQQRGDDNGAISRSMSNHGDNNAPDEPRSLRNSHSCTTV
ncbi:uncharacterized protein LOC141903149 isoform X2 [Tubulanus polymorphus]|uniref:uncharacterized protein LOC141903149 isoform X2 n=1 Tax=Tubulanus polymorphus TaxID=672921 RepID=UPI003DA622DB